MNRKLCLVVGVWCLVFIILTLQNIVLRGPSNGLSILDSFSSLVTRSKRTQNRRTSWGIWFTYQGFCVWSLHGERQLWDDNQGVTLCTQGTPEYLHHISEQCTRWEGPISVAVYGPEQFNLIKKVIHKFRKCNSCVRSRVSWHVFYESRGKCPTKTYPPDSSKSSNCSNKSYLKKVFRKRTRSYPINVARNLARLKSASPFIMSVDIELYPSRKVATRFMRMVQEDSKVRKNAGRRVWVLPVFEVVSDVEPPWKKSELRKFYYKGKAISFHKYRCVSCHKIPNLKKWMKVRGDDKSLHVVQVLKRDKSHGLQDWEPFYIGTHSEPDFDIRLSWEGKQNKMQVALEMCLLDYDFLLLDDAFLVHSPGINKYDSSKEKFRAKYIHQNAKMMNQIKLELGAQFPNTTGC